LDLNLSAADLSSDLWLRVRRKLLDERARLVELLVGEEDPVAAAKLRTKCALLRSMVEQNQWPRESPQESPGVF